MEVIPSARRLMDSLRDIGYELPAAVADIIDNSIAAAATEIHVDLRYEGSDSWVRVTDNGTGMPTDVLNEAMRYGSDREYTEADLGRFGLGLKTASMSQCRRLTVATRPDPDRRSVELRRWDLDEVEESDRWLVLRPTREECRGEMVDPLYEHPGTVVFWEDLDRVLRYKIPNGVWAQDGFARLCRDVEDHLAMVFHKFLSGEATRTLPLKMWVNGNPVEAWDPFCRSERKTRPQKPQVLPLHHNGRRYSIQVHPYVLPNEAEFSSTLARRKASGPRNWNRQQGFYIYRGDRLIQSGGWNRIRTPDEHTKLARIELDIPTAADTAFEINVSKMRVYVPIALRDSLTAIASAVCSVADGVYRQRQPKGSKRSVANSGGSGSAGGSPSSAGAPGSTTAQASAAVLQLMKYVLREVEAVVRTELVGDPESRDRMVTALATLQARLEEGLQVD